MWWISLMCASAIAPRAFARGHAGWVFIALMVFLLEDADRQKPRRRHRVLLGVQLAVIGTLVSFPVQSYGPVSIAFTTPHLLLSYALAVQAWRATRDWLAAGSRRLVRIAVVMMVISTIGVWSMAPLLAFGPFRLRVVLLSIQFSSTPVQWLVLVRRTGARSRWAETHGMAGSPDPLTIRFGSFPC
ncbi:MAG: hypothetical protein IPG92_14425 [Flavobacteriales bacterium]|nr:hypothetical protein [Flavobacteriales bacterium]